MPRDDRPGHIHALALHPLRRPCLLDSNGSLDLVLPGFVISISARPSQLQSPMPITIFSIVFEARVSPVVRFIDGWRREDVV